MTLHDAIFEGVLRGVDRHWVFSKDMLYIKPEYLLTVFVAERLCSGFDDASGIDLSIRLEEPTYKVVADLWMKALGWSRYFKNRVPWKGRTGKVDIFVEHELTHRCHVLELKNFDPSASEVNKELKRFVHLMEINSWNNSLESCHIAFPSQRDRKPWLLNLATAAMPAKGKVSVESRYVVTGEDPEDGLPAYYCNVASFYKADNLVPD